MCVFLRACFDAVLLVRSKIAMEATTLGRDCDVVEEKALERLSYYCSTEVVVLKFCVEFVQIIFAAL